MISFNLYISVIALLIVCFSAVVLVLKQNGKLQSKKSDDIIFIIFCGFGIALLIFIALDVTYYYSLIAWEKFKLEPYKLEFKDCLNATTQIVTFLGSTTIAAITAYLTLKKKNGENKPKP